MLISPTTVGELITLPYGLVHAPGISNALNRNIVALLLIEPYIVSNLYATYMCS